MKGLRREPLYICQRCGEQTTSITEICIFCKIKIEHEKEHEKDEKIEDPEIFDHKPLTLEILQELNLTKDQICDLGLKFYTKEGGNPAEDDFVFSSFVARNIT